MGRKKHHKETLSLKFARWTGFIMAALAVTLMVIGVYSLAVGDTIGKRRPASVTKN